MSNNVHININNFFKNKTYFKCKMENLSILDINNICRVCLCECEQMYSIYSELCEVESTLDKIPCIYEILMGISSIKVRADDGLPSIICAKCVNTAHLSYKFQKQCNHSQTVLEAYIKQNQQKTSKSLEVNDLNSKIEQNPNLLVVEEQDNLRNVNNPELPTDEISNDDDDLNINNSKAKTVLQKTPNDKSFSCPFCEKSYKYASSLRAHMRNHTQEKPYICKLCGKSFKQYSSLYYHKRTHTGERPYSCKLCGKKYKQSGTLTAHMRIHTGQKPFLCSICGRGFRQAPDLGYHMRSHTKEKPYMCNVCGKTMSMQSHLIQHMRIHTGEKPYKCNVCEKAFPSSTRLKRHAIIHTNLKPYSCEVCSKSFNRMSSLKVHAKTHTDERSHVCNICNKGFIQAHALRSHLTSHSSEVVYLF